MPSTSSSTIGSPDMGRRLNALVCRLSVHDLWAVSYPPARRWECRRCGAILEEAPWVPAPEVVEDPTTDRGSEASGSSRPA